MNKRRFALYSIIAVFLVLVTGPAGAQNYPARRITIVVPYTAGSGFDTVARTIGQKVSERWGQPVVIDNKAGASGNIGAEAVANAPPDGYTLLMTGAPHTVSASLSKTRFDPVGGFSALGNVGSSGLALVVNPTVFPVNSLTEFVAYAKARPGQLNHSSPGLGTLQHLGMELFKQQLGIEAVHVPYRGAAPALTDLLTGQVHFTFLPVHTALPHVQEGKLRMLAVASAKRSAFAPDVPTLAELGYPTVDFELWYGFFGPASMPAPIVEKWEKELAAIATLPDVKEGLERQGIAPVFRDAAATGARVKAEVVRWREVAEKAGIKAE